MQGNKSQGNVSEELTISSLEENKKGYRASSKLFRGYFSLLSLLSVHVACTAFYFLKHASLCMSQGQHQKMGSSRGLSGSRSDRSGGSGGLGAR